MYAGTTLRPMKWFDAWFGAHQKINRVSRRHLAKLLITSEAFPTSRQIGRFEGLDGPDGIKRKSPSKDEPWHFVDPYDAGDDTVALLIAEHHQQLTAALRDHDMTRAAFECAWLSHAIVDGLTPAHHYPYEEELVKLRGGRGIESRSSPKEQLIIPGETIPKQVRNNWKMWGDKGLLATHFAFEWGVAAIILPLRLRLSLPTNEDLRQIGGADIAKLFLARAREIADLKMYDEFYKSGWTPRLAKQVRRELVPIIINTVTLAWYSAMMQAKSSNV